MIAKQRSLRVLYVNGNEFSTAVEPSLLKALESNHRLTLLQCMPTVVERVSLRLRV